MKEEDLRQLQNELDQLRREAQIQQHRIGQLQQRLDAISGQNSPAPPKKAIPSSPPLTLENFIGLRLINFTGIIVLVIGLSIGVKYAIDRDLISEGMRVGLAYLAGAVLFALSLRLRKKYTLFSALLLSGGMASLYFTTYAAYVYYGMFPFVVAFLLMVLLTVYTVYEATGYDRQEIALLGLVGAYAIPFLISKNADRPDLFFLYIALINLGVVYLAVQKKWKTVGWVAQVITWVLFIVWAGVRHETAYRLTATAFMVFFFLIFLLEALAPQLLRKEALEVKDGYQLLANGVALYLAALFLFGFSAKAGADDLAMITLAISGAMAVEGWALYRMWKEELFTIRLISSLALTLFILFIAFHWNGFTVTFLWLLTAVILFAWGFRARSVRARMAAILLIGVTLGKLVAVDSLTFTTVQKVIAYLVLGVLLLVVSFFYQKFRQQLFSDKDE